jgi:hypothetical protein
MATSIRLLSKTVNPDGSISVQFSDNEAIVFFSQIEYDKFVDLDNLDQSMSQIMKRVLLAWSHANQDAVNRQAIFDAIEVNRNIMRIRN